MAVEQKTKSRTFIGLKGSGVPTESHLKLINNYTVKDVGENDVYVRTMYLAHNAIDRDQDKFTKELLNDFVTTLPGKGLYVKHPRGYDGDSGPGVGRFFAADVIEMTQAEARKVLREPGLQWIGSEKALILEASFYMSRVDSTKDLITNIDNGVAGDVSIGFTSTYGDTVRNDKVIIAQLLTSPGEALEGSLVWLGAQPGARVVKSASNGQIYLDDGNEEIIMAMTPEEKAAYEKALADVTLLTSEVKTLKATVEKTSEATEAFDAVESLKGLGEKAIVDLAVQGQNFKKSLIDDVVKVKRNLKMIGDTGDDVKAAQKTYESMSIEFIKGELDGFKTLVKNSSMSEDVLDGGDPNGGEQGAGTNRTQAKDKTVNNPTLNKLLV